MAASQTKIDRQATCPFHLKLFYREGAFPLLSDFAVSSKLPAHLEIYTWPSCTLRELSHLLVSSVPSILPDPAIGTRLSFRLIYPDTRSSNAAANANSNLNSSYTPPARWLSKDLGSVIVGDENGEGVLPSPDNEDEVEVVKGGVMGGRLLGEPGLMLHDGKFIIGDYVAVAIVPPGRDGAPALLASAARSERGVVGNGYDAAVGGRGRGRDWSDRNDRNGFGDGFGDRGGGGGFRGRGRGGGSFGFGAADRGIGRGGVPNGEWRRGEAVPAGPSGSARGGFGGRGRERW